MLISSMDQLSYYSMPKDGYLEIDTSANTYQMGQPSMEEGSPTYMNEENSPKNGTKSSLYKTELCKRFSEFGSCRYGAKCQFAHGLAELRHVVRHPKYKTTKCKSYWGSGHCPYGSRCRFIHEEAESMTPPPFSPPGAMSGMFFREPSTGGAADGLPVSSPNGNAFYGSGATGNAASTYQKDYSLLGSFSNDASASGPWGPTPPSQLSHHHHNHRYGDRAMPPPPAVIAGPNGVAAINGAAYPDLQDAIDALMRFSLSPAEAEMQARAAMNANANASTASGPQAPVVSGAPLGTISTTPAVARTGVTVDASGAVSVTTTSPDYSLDADELWKDFPTLSSSSVGGGDFGGEHKQWPAGLSLSLEGTGLFSSSSATTSASTAGTTPPASADTAPAETAAAKETPAEPSSPAKKGDETSPRLSVFERFH